MMNENTREKLGEWFTRGAVLALLAVIFFVAGGGVSQNDRWKINTIEITGAGSVSTDAIRELVKEKLSGNYFFVYARENSYLYPQKEIEQTLLETFPRLASAEASRIDAHTIAIAVSERKPYALWCGDEFHVGQELSNCWFIDSAGFVFDHAPTFSSGVYMEVYGKLDEKNKGEVLRGMLPKARFTMANTFAQMMRAEIGEPAHIALKKEGELEIAIRSSTQHPFLSGVSIRFKDESSPITLITNLHASLDKEFSDNVALKKKLLYIDMRFGNKIFFGFEN